MALALYAVLLPFVDDTPDPVPAKEDVTAGWVALLVFVFLIVAVAVLARSLVKQLRKAQAARDAGVYGDQPAPDRPAASQQSPGAAPR